MEALVQFINQITGYNRVRDALKAFLGVVPVAANVEFVIGAEANDIINIAGQVVDVSGQAIREVAYLLWYLSSDTDGQAVGAAPSVGTAIGTDGTIIVEFTAEVCGWLITEADGDFDFNIEEAGALTSYLNIVMPSGRRVVSAAITHA